jgi:hypothetical protein
LAPHFGHRGSRSVLALALILASTVLTAPLGSLPVRHLAYFLSMAAIVSRVFLPEMTTLHGPLSPPIHR